MNINRDNNKQAGHQTQNTVRSADETTDVGVGMSSTAAVANDRAGPEKTGPKKTGPQKIGKVLSWAVDLDGKTMAQAQRSAQLPFVDPYVALMPDAHWGMGATVGSVIPTNGAIIPAAVGVDIGCGMVASRLNIDATQLPDDLGDLHRRIARAVPAGVGQGHEYQSVKVPELPTTVSTGDWWTPKMIKKVREQFGSLGSGNHFIEVCLDEADGVWVVLHSGSRGIGNMLAQRHIAGAKREMKRLGVYLEDPDLAHFLEGTREFDDYICDMLWAQDYAMQNRQRMMHLVLAEVRAAMPSAEVMVIDTINCHHNFTEREQRMGRQMWITRKGAIKADVGDRGVIPGSMGAETFVVSGTGSVDSFASCSHGAGRRLSRTEAKRSLTTESLVDQMAGVAWNDDPTALLDEHPSAYKDINEVMVAQSDLVSVDHVLHQVLNYKGT